MVDAERNIPKQELTVSPESLEEAIELVRGMQTGAAEYRREARSRGDDNEAGRVAERTAQALEHQMSGALQILDTLHQPPDGFHNWYEVVAEDSPSTSE